MGIFKTFKINDDIFNGNDFIEDYNNAVAKITDNPFKWFDKLYIPSTVTKFVEGIYKSMELNENFKFGMFYQSQKDSNIEIIVFKYDDIKTIFNFIKEKNGTIENSIEYLKNSLLNDDLEEFARKVYNIEKIKKDNSNKDYSKANDILLSYIQDELKGMDLSVFSNVILNIVNDSKTSKEDKKIMIMLTLQAYIDVNYNQTDNEKQEQCTDYVANIKNFINKMNE